MSLQGDVESILLEEIGADLLGNINGDQSPERGQGPDQEIKAGVIITANALVGETI